jgi:Asp-tRNA(Asn)/Glu-tRNA(Gln) amidotransferase A subunit family amidase
LPLFAGDLPIGAQLVGPRGRDGRLLRTASTLIETLTRTEKNTQRSRARR